MADIHDLKIDRTVSPSRRKRRWPLFCVLAVILVLLFVTGWFFREAMPFSRPQPQSVSNAALAPPPDLAAATVEYQRNTTLFKIGAAAKKQVDASEAALGVARAELAGTEAELQRARWKVDQCIITAPVDGVILEVFAQPGEWVSLIGGRERPAALLTLFDPKKVQAWVDVNQRDSGRVSVGQTAALTTDAQPGRPIEGRVVRILPQANLQKNTVQVKIEIPDPPADLRPQTSVKVTFLPRAGTAEVREQK